MKALALARLAASDGKRLTGSGLRAIGADRRCEGPHRDTHSRRHSFSEKSGRAAVVPHSAFFVNGMGGWAPFVVAGVLSGAALDARAQGGLFPCGDSALPDGRVTQVIDGRSLVLDDGREVRLAALDVPPASVAAGEAARAALAALISEQTLTLRAAAEPDRYGRIVAYAYTRQTSPGSVVHAMLAAGQARLGVPSGDAACIQGLRSQERVARAAALGLWGEPHYAIINARNPAGLLASEGRFAVVEGRVLSVRQSGGTIYANFGRRWSQALTVTISKRRERIFAGAGLEPRSFEDRHLRVRGWIEVRNGPRIEAGRPEQIEFVERN
ncbi:MAG: thermonuclease family protein [Hyphomicrobiales bacterium]|nr:thermonuclease family protein [Hyphomicrobiales bacterium]